MKYKIEKHDGGYWLYELRSSGWWCVDLSLTKIGAKYNLYKRIKHNKISPKLIGYYDEQGNEVNE